ncbi:CapA family protein [Burkholderia ubonensis]|uniref:CapA family protein n=1 Tax=Burkholderia ubonensis TaxID=101571 RepID=UPI0012FCD0B8|nr:CapA family protein [Burkholderia ubonensis]
MNAKPGLGRIVFDHHRHIRAEVERNLRQIEHISDFTIVTQPTHGPDTFTFDVSLHFPALALKLVDCGASMRRGHASHQLHSNPIYNGKPPLYSRRKVCFIDQSQPNILRDEWEGTEGIAAKVIARSMNATTPKVSATAEFLRCRRFVSDFSVKARFFRSGCRARHPVPGISRLAKGGHTRCTLKRLQVLASEFGSGNEVDVAFDALTNSVAQERVDD